MSKVEWKKLGEVCKVHTGCQLNRADMLDDGLYPVVNGGREYSGYIDKHNEVANTITISQGGESAGFVNWIDVEFWAGAHCYVVEETQSFNKRYLYHTLKNIEREIQVSKQGAGIPGLNRNTLYKQIIPIPSLSEQRQIAAQLDTFTSSIENLKEQIAQRRKQYEYYRDQLLDLEEKESVESKRLNEITIIVTDGDHLPPPKSDKGIPFITISNIDNKTKEINFDQTFFVPQEYYDKIKDEKKAIKNDILYTVTGSYGIPVFLESNKKFCFQRHIGLIRVDSDLCLPKYCYYWLDSIYAKKQADECASGGAQKTVSLNSLRNFRLHITSKVRQEKIISILDTFEASIQNLEAQLKQREKQYEYYRNKLLTFN